MENKKEIIKLYESKVDEIYKMTNEKQQITNKLSEQLEILHSTFSDKQLEIFNKLEEYETQKDNLVHKEIFVYAFSLATKLFIEGLK